MFNYFGHQQVTTRINPYGAELEANVREPALAATGETIKAIVGLMRAHDIPDESFPTVCRIYEHHVMAQAARIDTEKLEREAVVLPVEFRSVDNNAPYAERRDRRVPPNTSVSVIANMQRAMHLEELVIDDPDRWYIDDLTIGNKTQFSRSGGMPASVFAESAFLGKLKLDVAQVGMDIALYVRYVGSNPEGEVFVARARAREWVPTVAPMFAV